MIGENFRILNETLFCDDSNDNRNNEMAATVS